MATITIEIPDEIAQQYESLDEIRRTMYEDFVIEQRQQGKFSLGEAAKLLNISYTEFFDLIGDILQKKEVERERRRKAQKMRLAA